jgi:biotin--protein ligase
MPQGAELDVRIKWPNDIYANNLKLGGILCHSSYREGQFHVIMGVGLNVSNREPTTCVQALVEAAASQATGTQAGVGQAAGGGTGARQGSQQQQQLQQHPAGLAQPDSQQGQQQQPQEQQQGQRQAGLRSTLEPVSRESLLAGILSRLEPMLRQLADDGFEPFQEEYCCRWLHSGQQVTRAAGVLGAIASCCGYFSGCMGRLL